MSLWLFALGILAYVKELIVEFKTDPQSRRYDNVISPSCFRISGFPTT